MTGVEKIKDRILEEARSLAKANIERAEADAANMIEAAEKEAEEKKRSIIEKAKNEASEAQKRLFAIAELEARKARLKARQEVVEEAFAKALDKLSSLPDMNYQAILMDMIVQSIESGNEEIILSERDKKRVSPDFIDIINTRSAVKGLNRNIRLSNESAGIRGGFILKSGNVEINNSFEVILRMKRDELEGEVFKQLF